MKKILILITFIGIGINSFSQQIVVAKDVIVSNSIIFKDSTITGMFSGIIPDTSFVNEKISDYATSDTGDMKRIVYDIDNDSIVDSSEVSLDFINSLAYTIDMEDTTRWGTSGLDSIYQVSSGTWTTDTITKDTVYNSITYQYTIADTMPNVPGTLRTGMSYWDEAEHTFTDILENGVKMQRGAEMPKPAINLTGSTIANGRIVYIVNAGGETPRIALADNRNTTSHKLIGMTTSSFPNGSTGYVTTSGKVHELNTSGFVEGNDVYLGITGLYTQTRPTTGHIIKIGTCYYAHASNGIIDVDIQYLSANGQWNIYNYNGTSGTFIDTNRVTTDSVTSNFARFGINEDTTRIDNNGISSNFSNGRSFRVGNDSITSTSSYRMNTFGYSTRGFSIHEYDFGEVWEDLYQTSLTSMSLQYGWPTKAFEINRDLDSVYFRFADAAGSQNQNKLILYSGGIKLWNHYTFHSSDDKYYFKVDTSGDVYTAGKYTYPNSTFENTGVNYHPSVLSSVLYDPDSGNYVFAQALSFASDTLDTINVKKINTDTISINGEYINKWSQLSDRYHALSYYVVSGDDTLGGSSPGNPIDIVTQYSWVNCRLSSNTWSNGDFSSGFTYINDTIQVDSNFAKLTFNAILSVSQGTGSYQFRWYNITDNSPVLPNVINYTVGATTPIEITIPGYYYNNNAGDKYTLQVRNLSNTQDLILFSGYLIIKPIN